MTVQAASQSPAQAIDLSTVGNNRRASSAQSNQSQAPSSNAAATETVSISSAGKAAAAEATETAAQTAKEARTGDRQAQRLLAKEAASHPKA
ncbi:MAG TPA: hypothetical protein VH183_12435 [Burkholderiaceae bacterium]|jgi:hypothetical protein|nr:hypothetical protein [Burkholderiaceae bacterium]